MGIGLVNEVSNCLCLMSSRLFLKRHRLNVINGMRIKEDGPHVVSEGINGLCHNLVLWNFKMMCLRLEVMLIGDLKKFCFKEVLSLFNEVRVHQIFEWLLRSLLLG
jgi:hypothetical protein